MQSQYGYAAYLEECLIITLTNAAFFIDLASEYSFEPYQTFFLRFSGLFERYSEELCETAETLHAPHLNPALFKRSSGDKRKDLTEAYSAILVLKMRLFHLSAYAPDAYIRRRTLSMITEMRPLIDLLSSLKA